MARRRGGRGVERFRLTEDQAAELLRGDPAARLYYCPCGARGRAEDERAHKTTLTCRTWHHRLFRKGLPPVALRGAWELFYAVRPYLIHTRSQTGGELGFLDPAPWQPMWRHDLLWAEGVPFDLIAQIVLRHDERAAAVVMVAAEAGATPQQLYDAARIDTHEVIGSTELEPYYRDVIRCRPPKYAEIERALADAAQRALADDLLGRIRVRDADEPEAAFRHHGRGRAAARGAAQTEPQRRMR